MYNEDQKQRFIAAYTQSEKTKNFCELLFKATQVYETAWGADICTRSAEELKPVIEKLMGLRHWHKNVRLSILKSYAEWCLSVNVPGATSGLLEVVPEGLEKMKQQSFANPTHLELYLDSIYDREDEETLDNIYRTYYWLAYVGVKEEDILQIKTTDVDLANMEVKAAGKAYPILFEALPAIRNCVRLQSFVFKHPNYTKLIRRERIPGDGLLRGIRGEMTLQSLRVLIARGARQKADETGMRPSYYRIRLSGIFYRAFQLEQSGKKPDFMDLAEEDMQGKTYKFDNVRNTYSSIKRQIARDYQKDYERWKLAYRV